MALRCTPPGAGSALAGDPAPPRALEDAATFPAARDAALAVTKPQHTAACRRWLNARIHAVKTERASLHARAFIARQLFDGSDEACERQEIERR